MFILFRCHVIIHANKLGYNIEDYQVAPNNYKHEISLPIYPQLTKEEVDYVVESVIEAYDKVRPR